MNPKNQTQGSLPSTNSTSPAKLEPRQIFIISSLTFSSISAAVQVGDDAYLVQLLKNNSDNYFLDYALWNAANQNRPQTAKLVLGLGADPGAQDSLALKTAFEKGYAAVASLLVEAGADYHVLPGFENCQMIQQALDQLVAVFLVRELEGASGERLAP